MHISGAGPVDGYQSYISSSRAELTGITAVSIMAKLFLEFHNYRSKLNLICDNQGMLQKCANVLPRHFCSHRAANMDLLLTHHSLSSHLQISYDWVRGHSDKESWQSITNLRQQKLSRDKTYNVWCDRMAANA
jgi:hypothetical protein